MLDLILEKLPFAPMLDQNREEREESLPCSILKLAEESNHIFICGQNGKMSASAGFSSPPTTHLVATIEWSTDNAYTDEHSGHTAATGGTQTLGLVPSIGKWVQNITHAWHSPTRSHDDQPSSELSKHSGSNIEYCDTSRMYL